MDTPIQREQNYFIPENKPLLFILSGPSGVGKDAVLNKLKETSVTLSYIVTMTTRPCRENEIDGKDYNFVSVDTFNALLEQAGFLEHARVYGNMYGVPVRDVDTALSDGLDVMVKVDIQGVDNIRAKKPDAITIFLAPQSLDDLFMRLKQRNSEDAESLKIRMNTAAHEMDRLSDFDYVVVNRFGKIDEAVSDISSIIAAENCRVR